MPDVTIGTDVSKDHLDAHRLPDGAARQFADTRSGLTQLIRWIGCSGVARVAFERKGRYHLEFERRLDTAGLPVVKVNRRQAKRFVQALGVRAKTDRADAAMLARMGAALALEPQPVGPEVLQDLNDLVAARRALVKDRTAAKNRAKGLRLAILSRINRMRLSRIEADLEAIDKAVAEISKASTKLRARHEILVSISGISEVTAAAILPMMPELGQLDRKQVASLAGLAPVTRQSGRWTGKAFIQGGRAALRQALYMPAVVACRFNPDLKAKYDQLIGSANPAKLAITAVMRKLIVLANTLIRDNRRWQPAKV